MNRASRRTRERQNNILILCQGKTEEIYLKSFPIVRTDKEWSINVQVEAYSLDPRQLVEKSILMRDSSEKSKNIKYNSVWCIFDRDDFKRNFREAILLADKKNIFHAFAIESFELWLLLHFNSISIDSPLTRKDYIKELQRENRLPEYGKNEEWLQENISVQKLGKKRRDAAIFYSKELELKSKRSKTVYQKQNCTVHKIVEYLLSL